MKTKNGIKKGDVVICIEDQYFKLCLDKSPIQSKEYKVISVDGNFIWLDGFDYSYAWNSEYFEPKKQKTLTQILATMFLTSQVDERYEFERVFRLDAKF